MEPFLFTVQFGVEQKVPIAQFVITGRSADLEAVKFNIPYSLMSGKREHPLPGISLSLGGVQTMAVAETDLSVDVGRSQALVTIALKGCFRLDRSDEREKKGRQSTYQPLEGRQCIPEQPGLVIARLNVSLDMTESRLRKLVEITSQPYSHSDQYEKHEEF